MKLPLREQVPLAPLTTLGVGGSARYFVRAEDDDVLIEALGWAREQNVRVELLGGGSNVVVPDAGLDGLVIQLASRGRRYAATGTEVELEAAAGEPWDELVREAVERDLQGLECLAGIPGLAGATPIQNVGAYGQEVSETVTRVRVFDRVARVVRVLAGRECRFRYRDSLFKSEAPHRFVVLGVTFRLRPGAPPAVRYAELEKYLAARAEAPTLAGVRRAVLALRAAKSMLLDAQDPNTRSCGSFFTNPIVSAEQAARVQSLSGAGAGGMPQFPQPDGRVKLAAGWLIEQAGFTRGTRAGTVGLSSRHALSIVAHAGATAADVLALSERIRAAVRERFGVELTPEPVLWSDAGAP